MIIFVRSHESSIHNNQILRNVLYHDIDARVAHETQWHN